MISQKEFQRVKVHLSERQVQRLKHRYRPDSTDRVRHGNRGRAVRCAVSPPQKQLILTLARGKGRGFFPFHGKTLRRTGAFAQPRDRARHPAGRETALSAEAPTAFRHDRAHRRQPS
jgi:hypothetical protein